MKEWEGRGSRKGVNGREDKREGKSRKTEGKRRGGERKGRERLWLVTNRCKMI